MERDSGLAGEIYGVCEEIFEKHLTVLMFTMLDIYSHPPVDVQSVCLDVFESVEKKNSPCKRGDFIFGQSPKRYWQRTSAFQIGLPAMQLLFTTHKWVPWIEQTYLIDFFISF